jgi:hypothetical protein
MPAARYTNLRDIREFDRVGFIDINWKNYNFQSHLSAVRSIRPLMTVARDLEDVNHLSKTLDEANELAMWTEIVVIVPKVEAFKDEMEERIPAQFLFGYSTPTKYGGTSIPVHHFTRPVHLLGGSPSAQLALASSLNVHSFDCNRFTLDARYGDFFDGTRFRPHPIGGYRTCLEASVEAINRAWGPGRSVSLRTGPEVRQIAQCGLD